jgi:hypothetical protein
MFLETQKGVHVLFGQRGDALSRRDIEYQTSPRGSPTRRPGGKRLFRDVDILART